jgi:hypothetical protein
MPSLAHWGWALVFVFDGGDGFPLEHGRRRPGEQVLARAEVYLAEHYFVVAVESELHHQPPRPDAAPFLLRHEREALPVAQPPVRLHEHGPRASLRVPAPFPHRARLALALAGLGPYGGEEVPGAVAVARHGGGEPVRELGGVRGVDVGVVDERARRLGAGDARTEVRLEQLVLGRVGEESRARARRRRLVGEARRRGYHSVSVSDQEKLGHRPSVAGCRLRGRGWYIRVPDRRRIAGKNTESGHQSVDRFPFPKRN